MAIDISILLPTLKFTYLPLTQNFISLLSKLMRAPYSKKGCPKNNWNFFVICLVQDDKID